MSERCFVRVAWDPASTPTKVGRAVGGFLRYIQHRDLHRGRDESTAVTRVAGILKYAAYREGASTRAELFCPEGRAGSRERKAFAAYVVRSIEESRPHVFRSRDGKLVDRRRVVYRFIISPERADGIDLEGLLRHAVEQLEVDIGVRGLRWLAAIHRNTAHHHIHFVLAGLQRDAGGRYRRVDVPKQRLAAMKEALVAEIDRQRAERSPILLSPQPSSTAAGSTRSTAAGRHLIARRPLRLRATLTRIARLKTEMRRQSRCGMAISPLLRVRAAAHRYAWQSERDAANEARERGWEHAA